MKLLPGDLLAGDPILEDRIPEDRIPGDRIPEDLLLCHLLCHGGTVRADADETGTPRPPTGGTGERPTRTGDRPHRAPDARDGDGRRGVDR